MRHERRIRNALSMVSYLFLLVGLISFAEMAVHIAQGAVPIHFNFGVLGIGIFIGLRRYSRAWHTCALLFTWYGFITMTIALLVCIASKPHYSSLMFFHQRLANIPPSWLAIPLVMMLLVSVWQYRILTHPAVRRLFNEQRKPQPAVEPESAPAPVNADIDEAIVK